MTEDTELDAFLEDSAADAAETEDIVNELEQDPESMEPQTFTVRGHVCEIRFSRKRIDSTRSATRPSSPRSTRTTACSPSRSLRPSQATA
jgi:hypothetical protein